MPTVRFEYIFDPLCGWCYASAPALAGLAEAWPDRLDLIPSGLFSGSGARDLTPDWADYAWGNDQRIARMTGQIFSEAYHRDILHGAGVRFDSGPMNRVLTAAKAIDAMLEPKLLHRLQVARYVAGEDTGDVSVVARIAAEVAAEAGHALDAADLADRLETDVKLAQDTRARIEAGQALMSRHGLRGVPQLLIRQGDNARIVDSAALYQGGGNLVDQLSVLVEAA